MSLIRSSLRFRRVALLARSEHHELQGLLSAPSVLNGKYQGSRKDVRSRVVPREDAGYDAVILIFLDINFPTRLNPNKTFNRHRRSV